MKKTILVFSLLFFLIAANSVFAQSEDNWTYVTENDDYKVYLDKDRLKKVDDEKVMYDVWLKWECKTDCNDGFKSIQYSIQNWNLYCETREYNVPKTTDYYTDGDTNEYVNETISPILENSPGEKILEYFCVSKSGDPSE